MNKTSCPIFVIGAGRSGTSFLSKCLDKDHRFKYNFENRYIWNYGQKNLRTDRRVKEQVTQSVKFYIRDHFERISSEAGCVLIDKTPGNSLKLPFIFEIFPEAKVINIIRDGRANILSRQAMWGDEKKAQLNLNRFRGYFRTYDNMRKRANLPYDRVPIFLGDSLRRNLKGLFLRTPLLFGERIPGLEDFAKVEGIEIARAIQWRETVAISIIEGRQFGDDRYHEVFYEQLLSDPIENLHRIAKFLNIEISDSSYEYLTNNSDPMRAIAWKESASIQQLERIDPYIRPLLKFLGYE